MSTRGKSRAPRSGGEKPEKPIKRAKKATAVKINAALPNEKPIAQHADAKEADLPPIQERDDAEESEQTEEIRKQFTRFSGRKETLSSHELEMQRMGLSGDLPFQVYVEEPKEFFSGEKVEKLLEKTPTVRTTLTRSFFDYFSAKCAPNEFLENEKCVVPDEKLLQTVYNAEMDSNATENSKIVEKKNLQRIEHFKNFHILNQNPVEPTLLLDIEKLRQKLYLTHEKELNMDQKKLISLPIYAIDNILNPITVIFTKLYQDSAAEKEKNFRVLQGINTKSLASLKLKPKDNEQTLQLILAISSILIHTVTDLEYIDLEKYEKYPTFAFQNIKNYMGSTRIINSYSDLFTKPDCFPLNENTCRKMDKMCAWTDDGCRQKGNRPNEFLKKEPTFQTIELKNQYEKSLKEVKKGLEGFVAGTQKICLNALRSASSMIKAIPKNQALLCALATGGFYLAPLIEPKYASLYDAAQILGNIGQYMAPIYLGAKLVQNINEKPVENNNNPYATALTPEYFKNNF